LCVRKKNLRLFFRFATGRVSLITHQKRLWTKLLSGWEAARVPNTKSLERTAAIRAVEEVILSL
jgi:hypothetical protein